MMRNVARAIIATLLLAVLTGLVYPLVLTGFAQVTMRHAANGNIVQVNGAAVGSSEIGQAWTGAKWFYGRPSAIENDASTSSGSNLGPTSKALEQAIAARVKAILALEGRYTQGLTAADIPADLLTASSSGLDPDISPAAAAFEAPRIAAVRHLPLDQVKALIASNTSGRTLGFLGGPRVNVLELNLALQQLAG